MSGELERQENQIFVRNLAYDVTEEDLIQIFEVIGPLKNVSIAFDSNKRSKGFGFIKYSLDSDAQAAVAAFQGKSVKSRPIKLEIAMKREGKATKKCDKEKVEQPSAMPRKKEKSVEKPKAAESEHDSIANTAVSESQAEEAHIRTSRQLLVFGVPVDVNKKVFKKVLSKISRKTVVDLIKEDHELSQSLQLVDPPGKVMLVTAESRQEAGKVAKSLETQTIRGLGLPQLVKQQDEEGEKVDYDCLGSLNCQSLQNKWLVVRPLSSLTGKELRKRKCRVILRNLSFQAHEQNVLDKLRKFGPIADVDLPRRSESGRNERPLGFAFVTFLCREDAERAVSEGGQGSLRICNRPIAIDFSFSKETYVKFGAVGEEGNDETGEEGGAGESPERESKGAVEVDNNRKEDDEDEDRVEEDEEGGDDDDDSLSQGEREGKEDEQMELSVNPAARGKQLKYGDDAGEGLTVFVRGLAFDVTDEEVRSAVKAFGPVELSLIVRDKLTKISKGSAFVKFKLSDHARDCILKCEQSGGLVVKGRSCQVMPAVDRKTVETLKAKIKAKDKRCLYLANEGLVTKAEALEGMSARDREKRERAQSEKKKKLLNPLFFVSATRLSIRNLSKTLGNQDLRNMCLSAARKGILKGLVSSHDMQNLMIAQGLADVAGKGFDIPSVAPRSIKSVRVMLDLNRLQNGSPRSKGYGFVEFEHHAHALACLRELNNNSQYADQAMDMDGDGETANKSKSKLVVEFTLENIRKVKLLQERQDKVKSKKQEEGVEESVVKGEMVEKEAQVMKGRKEDDGKARKFGKRLSKAGTKRATEGASDRRSKRLRCM